jgi:hypothetical protein
MANKINVNRRWIVGGTVSTVLGAGLWQCSPFGRAHSMTSEVWQEWQKSWRWMEALANKHGWEVTPLKIDPPSSEAQIVALELKHGLKVPAQLRELLTGYSARVQFGWSIPSHLWPLRSERIAMSGGLRNTVWDIAHIDGYAIDNFFGWKKQLAARAISENRPAIAEIKVDKGSGPLTACSHIGQF